MIGFLNYKTAEGLTDRSVDSYQRILHQWVENVGDKKIDQLTEHDLNAYLAFMRTEYVPRRFGGDTRSLSPKTLRNIWITLCSFFAWAGAEFHLENPMKSVPAPRFQKAEVEPFSREEITHMLKACIYAREADTLVRRRFVMHRPTAKRDQAVLLTLFDSGIRASEFCALRIGDFDAKRGKGESRTLTCGLVLSSSPTWNLHTSGPVNPDTYQPPADPGYIGYAVKYYYDDGANGLGRRTSMADASGSTIWTYNVLGQVTNGTQNIDNTDENL